MQLYKDKESYYKQKFRIQWLQLGDRNTKFFNKSLLHHQVRNIIHSLPDEIGNFINDQLAMGKLIIEYYKKLLTAPHSPNYKDISYFFPNTISDASISTLSQSISN